MSQPASADDGGPAQFSTTRWTVVLSAAGSDSPQAEALEQLCRTYWPPLFAFLRRQGSTPHEAEDIVQGFFDTLTGSTRSGTGGILQITLSNDLIQPQQFYRVQQLP